MHKCNACHKSEGEVKFGWRTVDGKRYKKHICNGCRRSYEKQFVRSSASKKQQSDHNSRKERSERANGKNVAKFILSDSKKFDKKRCFDNDLDHEFIEQTIANECHYCGETELKMTLDRIDNSKGHVKTNVLPACIRCNYLRRDMPIEAWMVVSIGVRKARNSGLFGSWDASTKKKNSPL